jgi:hypothetical protein
MKKTTRKTAQRANPAGTRLHQHWREFIERLHQCLDRKDETSLEAITETFRAQVRKAAEAGVETSITWHSLGMWTWDATERILCFARALNCLGHEEVQSAPTDELGRWTFVHYKAACRFEMARAYAEMGHMDDARSLLQEALPYARAAEDMPVHGPTLEGNLEGRIAGELLLLDAEV